MSEGDGNDDSRHGESRDQEARHLARSSGVWSLVTAAEMQGLDRYTISELGVPGEVLMESAGRALVAPVVALRGESRRQDRPIRVLCGCGNNGGDGFVLVRHLVAEGIEAEAILLGDPKRLPRDAASNWDRLARINGVRRIIDLNDTKIDWAAIFSESSVVVDALFGIGLKREISGPFAELVTACNAAHDGGLPVLSVDMPTGIATNTGAVLGTAIEADHTITISQPKIGLVLEPGASHAGRITVARIGIADANAERLPRVDAWDERAAAARLPLRGRAGHKGSFGHVLVIAGSTGKTGAGVLCARASLRAGAGLVTLAHPVGLETELAALPVEVMSAPVAATADGRFARAGEKAIEELVASRDVVALGPGLDQDPETVDLVRRLVAGIDLPLVIDADGLNALVDHLDRLHHRRAATVLTPHPGEAARLLKCTAGELNADRVAAARALAHKAKAVVILKGARTVIADPTGRALVTPTGGPALATGGTGDVLTGIVAALLASGCDAFEAAGLAAWWHGAAADGLPQARVGFGLLASELADALPEAAEQMIARAEARTLEGDPGGVLDLQFS